MGAVNKLIRRFCYQKGGSEIDIFEKKKTTHSIMPCHAYLREQGVNLKLISFPVFVSFYKFKFCSVPIQNVFSSAI